MFERRIVGLLLTVMAIYALAAPLLVAAQGTTDRRAAAQNQSGYPLRVRVDSVLAANTDKGMDSQLDPNIGERLKALFEYSTYRLVLHQELETVCGRGVSFEIPGGGILHIAPRSIVNNMISLELVLFEGSRPLMTTDLRMINHAVLMIGGPHYQQGMLITIITIGSADLPAIPSDRRTSHKATPPPPTSPSVGAVPADTAQPSQQ